VWSWCYSNTCTTSEAEITPPAAMARRPPQPPAGGDTTDIAVALQIAFHLEGVERRPR
jgi:hypothetical protein